MNSAISFKMEYLSNLSGDEEFVKKEAAIKLEEANIQEDKYENGLEKNCVIKENVGENAVKVENSTIKSEFEINYEYSENNGFITVKDDFDAQLPKYENIQIKSEIEDCSEDNM